MSQKGHYVLAIVIEEMKSLHSIEVDGGKYNIEYFLGGGLEVHSCHLWYWLC